MIYTGKHISLLMKFICLLLLILIPGAQAETIHWYDYEEGILAASTMKKPILIDFYADWCGPCIAMEENTYPDARVVAEMADFVPIKVDTQKRIDIETRYGINYYPTVVFLDPKGTEITRHIGYLGPEEMVQVIKDSRLKVPVERKSPGFVASLVIFSLVILSVLKKFKNTF